jgi:hypothetical protein
LLPLRATLWGDEGREGYVTAIGPLLLGLGLLAPLAWRRAGAARRLLATAGGVALVGLVVWAVGGRLTTHLLLTRLHLVIFPAYAALAAVGFTWLARQRLPGVRLGRIAGVLILLVVGLNTFELAAAATAQDSLAAILGQTSEADYLAANLGDYGPAMQALAALPDDAQVVMLWETRGLYCQPRCDSDEIIDRWWARRHRDPQAEPSAAAILAEWRAAGFTHALVYDWGVRYEQDNPRYTPADWQAWREAEAQMTLVQEIGESYRLYRLPDAP